MRAAVTVGMLYHYMIVDDVSKAEMLSIYFASVFTVEYYTESRLTRLATS